MFRMLCLRCSSLNAHRIQLDEAHNIKERSTNTAKAAFELNSKYKWCLSGTPLQNRVGELYSLVRFLGGDPFSYYFCEILSITASPTMADLRGISQARGVTVNRCIGNSATSGLVMVGSAIYLHTFFSLNRHLDCGHSPMQHVCYTCYQNYRSLTPPF
jgi:hypothetical protein